MEGGYPRVSSLSSGILVIALYIPGTDILYVLHCACVGRLSVQVFLGPGNVTLPKLRNQRHAWSCGSCPVSGLCKGFTPLGPRYRRFRFAGLVDIVSLNHKTFVFVEEPRPMGTMYPRRVRAASLPLPSRH